VSTFSHNSRRGQRGRGVSIYTILNISNTTPSYSDVTTFSHSRPPFPGSAQADLVLSADAVSTAGFIYLRVLCLPYGVLFTTSIFPWVGAGRPCALRSCGFNRRIYIPSCSLYPLCFLFTPTVFPGSAQADLVLFADAVSTAAHHQSLTASMIRFDSFFLQFDSLASKILCVLYAFYVLHFINTFHRFFLHCLPWVGAGRPCALRSRGFTAGLRILSFPCVFFLPPPSFPGRRRPTLCSPQMRFQPPLNRQPPNALHQPPTANSQPLTTWVIRFDSFFLIRFTGFKNSMCPLHLLYFSFHLCFPSCFSFPPVGAGRPCALRSCGFNRRVTDPIFPLWCSSHPLHLSWVGAGRPCALRSCGFNRQSPDLRIESI
jgi:hypothetical protein